MSLRPFASDKIFWFIPSVEKREVLIDHVACLGMSRQKESLKSIARKMSRLICPTEKILFEKTYR